MDLVLRIQNLSYAYAVKNTLAFRDFEVKRGSHTWVKGASGSGKTTLLHLLAGLLSPLSGTVWVANTPLHTLSGGALDIFRGKHMGMVFQHTYFVRSLTLAENLMLAQKLGTGKVDHARIRNLLDRLGIQSLARSYVYELSGGEQQRFSIARSLVNQPLTVLADEPTASLDDANASAVMRLLMDTAAELNATLIVVSHDQRVAAHFENVYQL
jgi:ABC-type lipoprotein export system ATPase subunit